MNVDQIIDRLQELPPRLPDPGDRFERVEERVRRRHRRITAVTAAAATAGLAMVVVLSATWGGGEDGAIDVVDPAEAVTSETPSSPQPGATREVALSAALTTTGTGTVEVDLGPRPADANAVATELTCLSAGHVRWPDGAGMSCSNADLERSEKSRTGGYRLDLEPGQTTLTITAGPGVSWKVVTTYVHTEPTDWATNNSGDTYGVAKPDGSRPDLMSAYATNGRVGYVYVDELDGYQPTSPADALRWQKEHGEESRSVPVYESDGVTVIGEFIIEPGVSGPAALPTQDP